MSNAMEKIQDKFRVRVIKKEADTRLTIAGEDFIKPGHPDHDGTEHEGQEVEYAVIPVHHSDHLAAHNKMYVFSDPFIPAEVKAQFQCPECDFIAKSEAGLNGHSSVHKVKNI